VQSTTARPYQPAPQTVPVEATAVVRGSGSYWVQAGSFSDPAAARRIAERLGARATVDASGGAYRVMVGPWIDANAAETARQAVVARGYADALLISGG